MNAWACIAARNEHLTIYGLVRDLRNRGLQVAVVDDGSGDATGALARGAGAYVIMHNEALGIGPSLMDAWRHALINGADRIVQIDAGGSHSPIHAWELLNNPADLMIGSRFLHGSLYEGRPWRKWLSRLASAMCNLKTGGQLSDWTSGYRAFSAEAAWYLLGAQFAARMHGWQIEVLGWALAAQFSIAEAPITYRAGESSFRLSTALEAFRAWRAL